MRLIDADALIEWIDENVSANTPYALVTKAVVISALKSKNVAPTVDEDTNVPYKWISVKDRLPETSGIKVIVSAKTVPESVLKTKAVFVAFLGYGDGKWYTPDVDFMVNANMGNDNVHPVWEITHWMFLPEPPEVDEK